MTAAGRGPVFKERRKFRPGDKIGLTPHTGTVHLFDKESGERLAV